MQNIDLIAIGKMNAAYFAQGVAEYQKRLGGFCNFRIIELPEVQIADKNASDKQIAKALQKEGEAILDFLGMLEAEQAVEEFEVTRNLKEVRNQVNRLVNCETANLQKTVDAAGRQIARIQTLAGAGRLRGLPDTLRETAEARLAHPDATLSELAALLKVGKSGINHRLRKLEKLAADLIEGE